MVPFRFRLVSIATLSLAGALSACQPAHAPPKDPAASEAEALEAQNFTHAPAIVAVTPGGPGFVAVTGLAPADSRIRFTFTDSLRGSTQTIGVTADGEGRFRAELPIGANGGLYDLTADDGRRVRQAEGRLFVPPGRPDKAVLMRPGSASRLLRPGAAGVEVVDYDPAGAFAVSGRVAPNTAVTVVVNDEIRAQVHSDAQGAFDAVTQVPVPGATPEAVNVVIQAAGVSFRSDVPVVAVARTAGDHVTAVPGGWRIDWTLPGNGSQSTIVF